MLANTVRNVGNGTIASSHYPSRDGTESELQPLIESGNNHVSYSASACGFRKNESETQETTNIAPLQSKIFNVDKRHFGSIILEFLDTTSLIKFLSSNKKLQKCSYNNVKQAEKIVENFKEEFVKTPLGILILRTVSPLGSVADTFAELSATQRLSRSPIFKPMEEYLLSQKDMPILKLTNILNPILKPRISYLNSGFIQKILFNTALFLSFCCTFTLYVIAFLPTANILAHSFVALLGASFAMPVAVLYFLPFALGMFAISTACSTLCLILIEYIVPICDKFGAWCTSGLNNQASRNSDLNFAFKAVLGNFILILSVSLFLPFVWWCSILLGVGLLLNCIRVWMLKKDLKCAENLISDLVPPSEEKVEIERIILRNIFFHNQNGIPFKQIEAFNRILALSQSASAIPEE